MYAKLEVEPPARPRKCVFASGVAVIILGGALLAVWRPDSSVSRPVSVSETNPNPGPCEGTPTLELVDNCAVKISLAGPAGRCDAHAYRLLYKSDHKPVVVTLKYDEFPVLVTGVGPGRTLVAQIRAKHAEWGLWSEMSPATAGCATLPQNNAHDDPEKLSLRLCRSVEGVAPSTYTNFMGACVWRYLKYADIDLQSYYGPYAEPTSRQIQKGEAEPIYQMPLEARDGQGRVRCLQAEVGEPVGQADCLTLLVYAPTGVEPTAKKAVAVWIHGGQFTVGAADDWVYEGSSLVSSQEIILAVMNYRLSFFGFLGYDETTLNNGLKDQRLAIEYVHRQISKFGGDPDDITLMGESAGATAATLQVFYDSHLLHDPKVKQPQRIIKRLISASNPTGIMLQDQATRFDEFTSRTAKATNCFDSGVCDQKCTANSDCGQTCPRCAGLLTKKCKPAHAQCNEACHALLKCDPHGQCSECRMLCKEPRHATTAVDPKALERRRQFECIRDAGAKVAKDAGAMLTSARNFKGLGLINGFYFLGPAIDGRYVFKQPVFHVQDLPIPSIQGTNREEGMFFAGVITSTMKSNKFGNPLDLWHVTIGQIYGMKVKLHDYYSHAGSQDTTENTIKAVIVDVTRTLTDYMFYCPMQMYGERAAPTWVYQSQVRDECSGPSACPGCSYSVDENCFGVACHANDVPTLFMSWVNSTASCCHKAPTYTTVSKVMQEYYGSFIKTGLPSGVTKPTHATETPYWPQYDAANPTKVMTYKMKGAAMGESQSNAASSKPPTADTLDVCTEFKDKHPYPQWGPPY